jgi:hypothetical protein
MQTYNLTYERYGSMLVHTLTIVLQATYSSFKGFLTRNWYLLLWVALYMVILWYIDSYQIANIVGGFN